MRRAAIRAAALAVLLAATPAFADQTGAEIALQDAAAQAVFLPDSDAMLAACPADIYASRRNPLREMFQNKQLHELDYCRDHADACAKACSADLDGAACVALANAMELASQPELDLPARRYHAFACALGRPGGCTNRGGGMRNVAVPGDPWWPKVATGQTEAAKQTCLYRSFLAACTGGDSWGCAMLGQAREFGEGVNASAGSARFHYAEACELAQDESFGACVFAREGLARLDQPPSTP